MAAKPLNVIVRQPTTETMNKMVEQMAQMVAPVKITAWGGCHRSLALVLDNMDYSSITKACITSTKPVTQPDAINKGIAATSTPLKILTFQQEMKKLQKEFDLQEAVTNIGVQHIIDSIKEQYIEELNKEYFGHANNTIKNVLHHLQTNWCKVMTRECTGATEAFYQAWVPNMTHIITFDRQLNKQQKKCKTINIIISDKAKTLHFVEQMYKSDYFTKEQMTKYKTLSDASKVWDKTLAHFTDLFSLRKAYGNDKTANSGFKSTAHVRDHSSARSVITPNTKSDFTRDLYIESLEESLVAAQGHTDAATCSPVPPVFDPLMLLQTELAEQHKQVLEVMAQNANSWQHSQRVAVVATAGAAAVAEAKAVAATTAVSTKPHGKRKTLPQLQESGCPRSCGVFLPQREQGQMPQGMGHQTWGMTGTGVPG